MGSPHVPQQSGVLPPSGLQEEVHGASLPRRMPCPDPPGGGTWFRARIGAKGPQDQMLEHARRHNHKFKVASDYIPVGYDKPVKMFASYPSWEDFIKDELLKTDPQNRHYYEVITEGEPCKLYLDVEWEGPADPERTVLHHLVDELTVYVKVRYFSTLQPRNFAKGSLSCFVSTHFF